MKSNWLTTDTNQKETINFIKKSGFPYVVVVSNYTTQIISDILNIRLMETVKSNMCFAAFAKIKSDVRKHPIPVLDKNYLQYFDHNFKRDSYYPSVINIDLKSAYATALYNKGILSLGTFEYMSRLSKIDRLACLGMLASKKNYFNYNDKGELTDHWKEVNPLENFFYHAVEIIQDVMNNIQILCGSNYLFTWVDGVYLQNDPDAIEEIGNYLKNEKYPYSIDTLHNFDVKIVNNKVKVEFLKGNEMKYFQIPARSSILARDFINFLTRPDS
ncbi:MAG TPA: hypothetical protein VF487_13220 [Chitinophagaceae bacterium]